MVKTSELRAYTTEFLGTFFLVFVTSWSYKSLELYKIDYQGLAVINGFLTASIIWSGFSYSGAHFNPVITISNLILNPDFKMSTGIIYITIQIISSLMSALIVILMTPLEYQQNKNIPSVGMPYVLPIINEFQSFIVEFMMSFFYVLIYHGVIFDKRAPKNIYGIAIGGVVLCGTIAFGPYSGACINPIRILGPSIISGYYDGVLIVMLATIFGGLFGGFYYNFFILDPENDVLENDDGKPSMKNTENYNLAMNLKY